MKAPDRIRVAQHVFALIGIVALGYCVAVWLYAKLYQAREARRFGDGRNGTSKDIRIASRELPSAPIVPEEGGLIGKLEIPRLGVSVMVVEGVESAELNRAVGHIPGTALPSDGGNVGIAGHRDTFFRPLRSIRQDESITLSTLEGVYHYRVLSMKVVPPQDVNVLYPSGRNILTLVTCHPFYYVGSAPNRFIVQAELLSSPRIQRFNADSIRASKSPNENGLTR